MMVRVTNSSKSVPKADVATGAGGRQPQNTARRRCHHLSYCTIYRCSRHSQSIKYYRNSQANQHIKLAILEKALIHTHTPGPMHTYIQTANSWKSSRSLFYIHQTFFIKFKKCQENTEGKIY